MAEDRGFVMIFLKCGVLSLSLGNSLSASEDELGQTILLVTAALSFVTQ